MTAEILPEDVSDALDCEPVHLQIHTDEFGIIDQVPLLDGRPAPWIRALKIVVAEPALPAVAVLEASASVDFEGPAHLILVKPE